MSECEPEPDGMLPPDSDGEEDDVALAELASRILHIKETTLVDDECVAKRQAALAAAKLQKKAKNMGGGRY